MLLWIFQKHLKYIRYLLKHIKHSKGTGGGHTPLLLAIPLFEFVAFCVISTARMLPAASREVIPPMPLKLIGEYIIFLVYPVGSDPFNISSTYPSGGTLCPI